MMQEGPQRIRTLARTGAALILLLGAAAAHAQSTPAGPEAAGTYPGPLLLELGQILPFFLLMLGPFNSAPLLAMLTANADQQLRRQLALRTVAWATVIGLASDFVGALLLRDWGVQLPALLIAAGLVLFFVAFQTVLAQFVWPAPQPPTMPEPSLTMALTPLALPATVTPYGLAVLILLTAAATGDRRRQLSIIGLFLLVMVINLIVLWCAPPAMKYLRTALLALALTIGVLQMALAIEMIGTALRMLGVLS